MWLLWELNKKSLSKLIIQKLNFLKLNQVFIKKERLFSKSRQRNGENMSKILFMRKLLTIVFLTKIRISFKVCAWVAVAIWRLIFCNFYCKLNYFKIFKVVKNIKIPLTIQRPCFKASRLPIFFRMFFASKYSTNI